MRRLLFIAMLLLPMTAPAREQIRIVGSSTVFPFVAAAAEQFGRQTGYSTPVVESTGTGGGLKIFCEGSGEATPDMANASRPIKPSELALCRRNGVQNIVELKLGFDGIVLANARTSPAIQLTREQIFLALAQQVPQGDTLVANPYKRWREIDPRLPDMAIIVYGPPPSSGTRDAFVELVMQESCEHFAAFKRAYPETETYKSRCTLMREDGAFVEAGEDDNIIVQKLANNPEALGLFGYSFLEQNAALVKANPIDGVMPSPATIETGQYHVARSLYTYVKGEHVGTVPALPAFVRLLVSDASVGPEGYLIMKGLLPLPAPEHSLVQKKAAAL